MENTKSNVDPNFIKFAQERGLVMFFADGSCEDLINTRYALEGWEAAKKVHSGVNVSRDDMWHDARVTDPPADGSKFRAVIKPTSTEYAIVECVGEPVPDSSDTYLFYYARFNGTPGRGMIKWDTVPIPPHVIRYWQPATDVADVLLACPIQSQQMNPAN